MQVLSIYDLDQREALQCAKRMRFSALKNKQHCSLNNNSTVDHKALAEKITIEDDDKLQQALSFTGGRLSYINRVSRADNIVDHAADLVAKEKGWLLSQIGLIDDCDDDVMDEQKWSSCSWLLLKEFVKLYKEREESGEAAGGEHEPFYLPSISYGDARQTMTRTDFIDDLDRLNIISIDVEHNIRPDSMLILQAAREVTEREGFDDLLESVRNRIDDIESLHRTRELTFKDVSSGDRIRLVVDKGGALLVDE